MRFVEIIHEEGDSAVELVEQFVEFAAEALRLEAMPQVVLMRGNELGTTFGAYVPGKHIIYVQVGNRHPVDVLRTLAHEMVHYRQDCAGALHERSGEDGSDHENEANAEAGRIMRLFGKANPDLFKASPLMESNGSSRSEL